MQSAGFIEKLHNCAKSGATVILSCSCIGDLATQFFAEKKLFCAGRVQRHEMERISRDTGAAIQSNLFDIDTHLLGTCSVFEEKTFGLDRYLLFYTGKSSHCSTFIIRGVSAKSIEETKRSLEDAIAVSFRVQSEPNVLPGGGAIEMEICRFLNHVPLRADTNIRHLIHLYAKAIEAIPRQLIENAGFKISDVIESLRIENAKNSNFGLDVNSGKICDMYLERIIDIASIKKACIKSATEAPSLIMCIDETIREVPPTNQTSV